MTEQKQKMKISRILFINLDRIGDVVRSTFIFEVLKKKYPMAYLACLSFPPVNALLKNDPNVDAVISLEHKEVRNIVEMHNNASVLHMTYPLCHILDEALLHDFDLVINPFSEFGAIVMRYLKPKYVLGRTLDKQANFMSYGKAAKDFFYFMSNVDGARFKDVVPFVKRYAQILEDLDIFVDEEKMVPKVYVKLRDKLFVDDFFEKNKIMPDDKLVGFQVGCFGKTKQWAIENFVSLAEKIVAESTAKIIINGSLEEGKTFAPFFSALPADRLIFAAGKMNLCQSVAMLDKMDLFISNDTGPMHIAAALDCILIGLFGDASSLSEEAMVWNSRQTFISKACINDISVDDVFERAKRLVNFL